MSPRLVTAGQALDPRVLAMTAGPGHTVAGPLHLRLSSSDDLRSAHARGLWPKVMVPRSVRASSGSCPAGLVRSRAVTSSPGEFYAPTSGRVPACTAPLEPDQCRQATR